MRRFVHVSKLYVLALPIFLFLFGAALNQAVLVANHDKFPVMLNERKVEQFRVKQTAIAAIAEKLFHIKIAVPEDDMIDDTHCIMTSQTHLNFLADYIDLHDGIYSPGDLIMQAAEWMWQYAPLLWAFMVIGDLWRKAACLSQK